MDNNSTDAEILVIAVEGPRLDAINAQSFREKVGSEIDKGNLRIVLNLCAVQFVDSTGIGALVGVLKRIGGRGDLALADLTPAVLKAFKLTRMDRAFAVFADTDAAVASLSAQ